MLSVRSVLQMLSQCYSSLPTCRSKSYLTQIFLDTSGTRSGWCSMVIASVERYLFVPFSAFITKRVKIYEQKAVRVFSARLSSTVGSRGTVFVTVLPTAAERASCKVQKGSHHFDTYCFGGGNRATQNLFCGSERIWDVRATPRYPTFPLSPLPAP